jgi:hypothetical protein
LAESLVTQQNQLPADVALKLGDLAAQLDSCEINRARELNFQDEKQKLLESLRFDEINLRQNDIAELYPDTSDWILQEKELRSEEGFKWDHFGVWLRQGQGLY